MQLAAFANPIPNVKRLVLPIKAAFHWRHCIFGEDVWAVAWHLFDVAFEIVLGIFDALEKD